MKIVFIQFLIFAVILTAIWGRAIEPEKDEVSKEIIKAPSKNIEKALVAKREDQVNGQQDGEQESVKEGEQESVKEGDQGATQNDEQETGNEQETTNGGEQGTGTGTGTEQGTGTGSEQGTEQGTETGSEQGTEQGTGTGSEQGTGQNGKQDDDEEERPSPEECHFINSLLGEGDNYNCCKSVTCVGGHITMIYIFDSSKILNNTMPSAFGPMPNLENLSISSAGLQGELPKDFENIPSTTNIDLSDNELTGSIPESFGKLKKLQYLLLNNNKFSGPIPDSLGDSESLSMIGLYDNELTGPIPESLEKLKKLGILQIQNNKLSGLIPSFFNNENFSLVNINLSNNTGLYGKAPYYPNAGTNQVYGGTSLCYVADDSKPEYTKELANSFGVNYDCGECNDNATKNENDNICYCNKGYTGIGYKVDNDAGCNKEEGSGAISIMYENSFFRVLGFTIIAIIVGMIQM